MEVFTTKDKINLSNAKALRRSREMLKVTRTELGNRLQLSAKAIEKYESGRAIIDEEKIIKFIEALNLTYEEFKKIKRGKGLGMLKKEKTVFSNNQRRSYKRVITKEVRVLKILRQMKNLTQDEASAICGYSRPSIGHIENGRIGLELSRICFIVNCYGHSMHIFESMMKEVVLRDEVLNSCYKKMELLSEEKLKVIQSVILNL